MLLMGSTTHQSDQKQLLLPAPCLLRQHDEDQSWMIMEGDQVITSSSSLQDSSASQGSSTSSSDMVDDASSTNSPSSSSSSSTNSTNNGPLFELAELMAQLPIKRGLSRYYQGKSQSFTSLSREMRLEDLAKKETPYRKRMKACKSYAGGLDVKATISKKVSRRGSFSSLLYCSAGKRGGSFLGSNNNSRLPPIPLQKHF